MVSKTQVDKAGDVMREWWSAIDAPIGDSENAAIKIIWEYRQTFAYPMTKVSSNLRYYVAKHNSDAVFVAQRHKRLQRIVEKLERHPKMRMSQMQDVGGCRAVVNDQRAAYGVLAGIRKNWDVVGVDDYVAVPRPTGYRALHAIVRKDGCAIEVQLRTFGQQTWADEVERLDSQTTHQLKDGVGPADALLYTRGLADIISDIDAGRTPTPERSEELRRLRIAAMRCL